jgi:hypothetical protein
MKLRELLNESPTDLVARYYIEASDEYESYYNGEAHHFANENKEYYKEYFENWFKNGTVPVFEKPVTPAQPEYRHNPLPGQQQSPGYRGKQNALKAAGLPYDHHVQNYNPRQQPYGTSGMLTPGPA